MDVEESHAFSETEIARALYPWGLVATHDPPPFDRVRCVECYAKGLPPRASTDSHPWRDDFTKSLSGKRGVVTDEEARFWFLALTDPARLLADRQNPLTLALDDLPVRETPDVRGRFTTWIEAFTARYRNVRLYSQAYLARLMLQIAGLEDTLELLLDVVEARWLSGFLDELYPSPGDDRARLAAIGRRYPAHENVAERLLPLCRPPVGVQAYLEAALQRPVDSPAALYHVLNAEPDDERFLAFLDALKPNIGRREVVLLLGRLGFDACDWIAGRVRAARGEPNEGLVGALEAVRSPRVVPALLHLAEQTTTAKAARAALKKPDLPYAVGIVAAAAGRTKSRDLAAELLAGMEREIYVAALAAQPESVQGSIEERVAASIVERRPELPVASWPGWMHDLHRDTRPAGLPRFCAAKHLRPLLLADGVHEVPASVVLGLLDALRRRDPEEPAARVIAPAMRVDLDLESAGAFLWSLFESWTQSGFQAAHSWCLLVVAELATDAQVLELAAAIEAWPSIGQQQWAHAALGVLEAHGSDTALAALNKIAKSSNFKALRSRAQAALTRLATRRGITPGQLEDLIIDDCGLEPDGTATFDYGPRQFQLTFGSDLAAAVRDEDGNVAKSLPRGRKTDDATLVEAARERYKTMKKRLGDVLGLQGRRLETALGEERRWVAERWREQYVLHPVMTHLVQRLLWAEHVGAARRLFRVTAERSLADVDDEELALRAGARVGLVHPVELSDDELAAWGAVFADYELLPPFPQLDRDVHGPADARRHLDGLDDVAIAPGWLRGHFNRRGWSKSPPVDGCMPSVFRDFHGAEIRAYATLEPGLKLDYKRDESQRVTGVFFVRRDGWRQSDPLPFKEVPAVPRSEALYDVHKLVVRAREL